MNIRRIFIRIFDPVWNGANVLALVIAVSTWF